MIVSLHVAMGGAAGALVRSRSLALLLGPPLPLLDLPFQLPAAQYASAGRDGRRLAVADRVNGQVIVLDRPQGDRCCLPYHLGVSRVTLSPDGRWVASGTWKPVPSVVRVADVAKRNVARVWGADAAYTLANAASSPRRTARISAPSFV